MTASEVCCQVGLLGKFVADRNSFIVGRYAWLTWVA